jgi:hypothetical protein
MDGEEKSVQTNTFLMENHIEIVQFNISKQEILKNNFTRMQHFKTSRKKLYENMDINRA